MTHGTQHFQEFSFFQELVLYALSVTTFRYCILKLSA